LISKENNKKANDITHLKCTFMKMSFGKWRLDQCARVKEGGFRVIFWIYPLKMNWRTDKPWGVGTDCG
jgi:hypothetical protein